MIKLNSTESQTLAIIQHWQKQFKNSPSIANLAHELRRSHKGTYDTVRKLAKKGYLEVIIIGRQLIIFPLYWE
jgi:Mn-dependent DtxR family transcriptional regulator